jgi:uncharacterized membrane protein
MWFQGADCHVGFGQWLASHWGAGFSLNLLIFFVLILLLYKLIRFSPSTPPKNHDVKDSLVILDQRLAKGTISLEDYQKIRSILQQGCLNSL